MWDYWIFDMDGTLTIPKHDFVSLRHQLDIPQSGDILAFIADCSEQKRHELQSALIAWERDIALMAEASEDALALLTHLRDRLIPCAILTRNTKEMALLTLEQAGLRDFFEYECILGRDSCAAKPSPEGIEKILSYWRAHPNQVVVIGDDINDMLAANAADCSSVFIQRDRPIADIREPDIICWDLRSLIIT